MKKQLIIAAILLVSTGALAQNGPGLYGGGYPGAKYSGQQDMLADLIFNGGSSVVGTGAVVLQNSPTINTPNIGTDFTINGVLFGTSFITGGAYNAIYNGGATGYGFQSGNATDPTNYYNNTSHRFRNIDGTIVYADVNSGGLRLFGSTSGSLIIKPPAMAGANTITLPAGTTDFSATGGTSQVVQQGSAGGALTVGQLAASSLSNGTTGSGAVVLAGTPTLTTPNIGAATGTSLSTSGDLTTTAGGVKITAATNPTITFGSGASTAATFISNGVATYHFHNSAGEDLFHINQNTGGVQTNYLFTSSNITANNPFIQATGSDTNIGLSIITKGTGGITFNGNAGASTLASLGAAGLTVPAIIGGTTASSTLTLESTSGAGTTDAIIGLTGSQVERFRITTGGLFNIGPAVTPDSQLTVNNNTAATVAPPGSTLLHIIGPDGNNAGQAFDSYGAGTGRFFSRNASGTLASPGAVAADKTLFTISGQGYDTVSYGTAATINLIAAETFTASAHGGYMTFLTTSIGATGAGTERMRLYKGLNVGNTNDPGAGVVQLKAQTFASLTACSGTTEGSIASITDSTTAVWGNTITGGSTNHVQGYCNGTNWTVSAK